MVFALVAMSVAPVPAQSPRPAAQKWVASWAASAHGPYPSGNASAQPVLDFAFESAETGANDQTFRLIIKPDLWGRQMRLRFSNGFGTRPVTFDGVFAGVHNSGATIVTGTNRPVRFDGGKTSVTIPPGATAFSDPFDLTAYNAASSPLWSGRKLAVSFHVVGATGPMTWHAKALTTSYLSAPRTGSRGQDETDAAFPFTTTSWYFVTELDVMAPADTVVVGCFGDSITDGTASTLNGDDRWPDVLSQRLHQAYATRVSVVNAGIGGNRITGPDAYTPQSPFAGGPSALQRLDRDLLSLAGLTAVVWLEGINDLSAGVSAERVIDGLKAGVSSIRAKGPIKVVGATITSSLGANGVTGSADQDAQRQIVNRFIRTGGAFDAVADFDAATLDPATGQLRAAFQPNSTTGGPGDHLHPNRAGYQAMGNAIDLAIFTPQGR